MKRRYLVLGLMLCISFSVNAQKYLGIATGNWGGLSGLYLNPASIADNRDRLAIDIIGLNAGLDNSLGKINTGGSITRFFNGSNTDINNVFTFSSKQQFSLLAPYAELRGPGFMMSINGKHSIAFATRVRGINQFNNFDQSLYRTVTDPNFTSSGNIDLTANKFNWTAHLWAEAAASYGVVLYDKGHHEIKAGITLRLLKGIGYLGLKGNNLDLHYVSGKDSIYANNTDLEYSSNVLNSSSSLTSGISNSNFFDQFFGNKGGNGFGTDIGVIYDYIMDTAADRYDMDGKKGLGDQTKNRYKVRVSASVTDIGAITYNGDNNFALNVKGNGYLTAQGLIDNVKSYDDFKKYVVAHGFNADTGRATTRLSMPATLILGVDYHAWRWIYVNATYITNLVNRQNFGNSFYGQVTIAPRFDTRVFSAAIPLTYSALAKDVKVGLGLRVHGFYIGSDDVIAFVANHQFGANVYVGGFIPFNKKKVRDRDGDHVSDRRDRCPDDMGTWENQGCPEKPGGEKKEKSADRDE